MFYLKIIIFLLFNSTWAMIPSKFIGIQDPTICVQTPANKVLSCDHQLEPDVQDLVKCGVKTISPSYCFDYEVDQVFKPEELPFDLFLYKFKNELLRTVVLNISFPQPEWKDMNFLIRNIEQPQYKICREFDLDSKYDDVNISNSLFWNCLQHSAEYVEENFYTLSLEDNNNVGGSYIFRIPTVNNYDIELTNETRWHVFFFLHQHYMEVTGKLFATLQPAPFSNISYSVSLVKCLNDSTRCDPNSPLHTIFINQERYSEESATPLTVELAMVSVAGRYAVTVQILSPFCDRNRCEVSISPVFELKNSYTVPILLGLLSLMFVFALLTFFVMRKIHLNFYDYIEGKVKNNMDTVLFVYHAETEELFYLFQILSKVFAEKFSVRPLLVDEHVGTKDPNDWTRYQLCQASKVLFFIPRDTSRDSATPIQHQWHCAITYFSGSFLKENQNIDSRCAAILLPDSSPPVEGNELYSLRRFDLKRDLSSLVNWLHRNSVSDNLLFWRPVARNVTKDLTPFIKYAVDPGANRRPDLPLYLCRRDDLKLGVFIDGAVTQNVDVDSLDDFNLDAVDEKIRNEFDPLIPDVRRVRFLDNQNDDEADDEDDSQSSDDSDDVTQFAT